MRIRVCIGILFSFIGWQSCTPGQNIKINSDRSIVISRGQCNIVEEVHSAALIDQIKYVPLETHEKCLLKDIQKIKYQDSTLFIYDGRAIYAFSNEGRFIAQIGERGRSGNEYNTISAFFLNRYRKSIILIDGYTRKALEYDYSGNFKSKTPIDPIYNYMADIEMADSTSLLCNFFITNPSLEDNTAFQYGLADAVGYQVKNLFLQSNLSMNTGLLTFSNHPITRCSHNLSFIQSVSNKIYQIEGEQITEMYSIEMIDPLPDERFLQQNNHKNYFELLQTLFDSGYSSGVTNLFETPQYLLVTFSKTKDSPSIQDYTLIWDKQKKRGTYYYRYFDDNLLTLSTCLNLNSPSTCYSENTFITAISPLTFGTNMHVILEKSNDTTVRRIAQTIKEDDNPVISFFTLKKEIVDNTD